MEQISDGYATSELPERWKAAVAWADVVIGAVDADPPTIDALTTTFSSTERAELTLAIAIAQGFSKAAIAWGPAPEIPTMIISTPGT